jgi:hypothetical protein
MSKYLLPCAQCGAELPIDVSQAGQRVACGCGAQVEAPTMRGIRQLPRADAGAEREEAAPYWSQQQGMLFASGAAMLAIGLLVCVYLLWRRSLLETERPEDRYQQLEEGEIDKMSPLDLWPIWQGMRSERLSRTDTPLYLANQQQAQQFLVLAIVSAGAAAVGLCVLVSAFFVRPRTEAKGKPKKRPPPKKKPSR